MASSATTASVIPVFSRMHYHIWAVKMKTYLKSQGLWKVVETDESTPALAENPMVAQLRTYNTESLRKDKALTCLHSGIADQISTSIMDLETPKDMWDKLHETFEGTDRVKAVRLLTLKREFELLRMKDDELVKDYSARMMDVFEAKISAIEESCDLDTLTVSELTSKLQAQDQRVSIRSGEKVEGAFRVSSRSNKDKPNFKCNFRNKFGHLEKYCKAEKAHNHTQGVQQANVSEEDQVDDEHLFMVSHLDEHPNSLTWLMDSGCTSHMTPERSFFISLDTTDNPRVKLGDGRYTRAKGRGTIAINTNKGTKYISRVLYVPELERSMLSVPQMIKNGYGVNFKDSQCVTTDSHDSKIAILDMVNDSYYLKLDVANASTFSVTEDDSMK
ncbi:retrovirus-related pol polyprotein from transposon TNT 1-94 [Tanacetum coccineum]